MFRMLLWATLVLFTPVCLAQTAVAKAPTTMTNTNPSIAASSTQAIAANPLRNYLSIQNNDGTNAIYCRPDGGTASTTTGIKILSAQMWVPYAAPRGAVNCINASGTNTSVIVTEGQ
jgi:hypothetical protein